MVDENENEKNVAIICVSSMATAYKFFNLQDPDSIEKMEPPRGV